MITADEFTAAYESNFSRVANIIGRRIGNDLDLEEITQAAWARAWERREQFSGRSAFATWVCVIALNEARSILRCARRRHERQIPDDLIEPSYTPDTLAELIAAQGVTREFARFSKREITVFIRLASGETFKEIADDQGLPAATIKVRVFRARSRLKSMSAPRRAGSKRYGIVHIKFTSPGAERMAIGQNPDTLRRVVAWLREQRSK